MDDHQDRCCDHECTKHPVQKNAWCSALHTGAARLNLPVVIMRRWTSVLSVVIVSAVGSLVILAWLGDTGTAHGLLGAEGEHTEYTK